MIYKKIIIYQIKYKIIIKKIYINKINSNNIMKIIIKLLKYENMNIRIKIIKIILFKRKIKIITKTTNFIIIFINNLKIINKYIKRKNIYFNHQIYIIKKYIL